MIGMAVSQEDIRGRRRAQSKARQLPKIPEAQIEKEEVLAQTHNATRGISHIFWMARRLERSRAKDEEFHG
jgi:hypothetical protein